MTKDFSTAAVIVHRMRTCLGRTNLNIFLNHACDQYENVVLTGDFNFSNIRWEVPVSTCSANELLFVESLNDHFLSQLNNTPIRGNNILDLVITSAPDHFRITEILSPDESSTLQTIIPFRLTLMHLLKHQEKL